MNIGLITVLLFGMILVVLATGLPLSFALAATGLVFAYFLWGPNSLLVAVTAPYSQAIEFILIAIPMFIFMAAVLERAGIAEDLYTMMHQWMGQLRGGLAMGTVLICTLFASMAGITGAATVTMGLIALPSMLKRRYKKGIAVGCISAGGALGVLIPPSNPMIVYGLVAGESIGRLFAGGMIPGLVLSLLFIIYIGIRCFFQRDLGPSIPKEEVVTWQDKVISLRAVALPIFLVLAVLGSIFSGIATPSEAASIGAAGSIICAAIYRRLNWQMLLEAARRTLRLSSMVMWILLGAAAFVSVYNAIGASDLITNIVKTLPVSKWVVLAIMQLSLFILGMFLDPNGIIMLTVPVYVPIIKALGFDPLWFGIVFFVNMEMSYLTPPFGFNLFYMKGVVPPEISMADIYRSVFPFVILQAVGLILVIIFPQLALWLPTLLIGGTT